MVSIQNLHEMSPRQIQEFLSSFDVVLSDCDGVLWYLDRSIQGAVNTLKKLQDLGKKIYLVTNNGTKNDRQYCEKIEKLGLEVKPEQIINTSKVIAWYLNLTNFHGEAFVIGTTPFRQTLIDSGIKVISGSPKVVEGDEATTLKAVQGKPSIKAVIIDFCLFCDWAKLALAISCLERKDVLYLCGAQDEWVVYGTNNRKVLGPGPLIDIITKHSGKTPVECAKPSEVLKEYVTQMCKIQNPKRCLLIGDTLNYDMKFGTMCGFIKLLVGTGLNRITDVHENDEIRPDFYIPNLSSLSPIIDSICNKTVNDERTE